MTHTILVATLAVVDCALAYMVFTRWRKRRVRSKPALQPQLQVCSEDGWLLLNLALENRSGVALWAEEARISLADLRADLQTAVPTSQATLKICETVKRGETLPISLIETVYNAAGKPQGEYSFQASGMVKYRVGEEMLEKTFQARQVKMFALNAIEVRRLPRGTPKNALNASPNA